MNLLETILKSQSGGNVQQLASQFGLDGNQANSVLKQLIPALAGGVKNNVKQGGLDSLVSALNSGKHDRYLDNAAQLGDTSNVNDGNAILGHIFGSKDVSREVAGRAAKNTGVDSGLLKKMLPVVATMVMGAMSKQSGSGGVLGSLLNSGGQSKQSSGIEGMLSSFLDQDGDGSIADDLLGKFFR